MAVTDGRNAHTAPAAAPHMSELIDVRVSRRTALTGWRRSRAF